MDRIGVLPTNGAFDVLSLIPSGSFILTASHDDCRSGALVRWVQCCSDAPPMVVVSLRKGHPIEPLIRDSRAFCLNLIADDEVLLRRKFEAAHLHGDDPFVSLGSSCAPSGSPILVRARGYLDCELTRHLDIESDYEVYIGLVRQARITAPDCRLGQHAAPHGRSAVKASA